MFKKRGDENVEEWVKEAIGKRYSPQDIRRILLRHQHKHQNISKVLSVYERLKGKVKSQTVFQSPIKKLAPTITPQKPRGKIIESYQMEIDKARVSINIEKTEDGLEYNLYIPEINIATRALLEEIRKVRIEGL